MPKQQGDKIFADAVRRAVLRKMQGKAKSTKLEALADELVNKGLAGDVSALKEIADRLDGKSKQAIDNTTTLGVTDPLLDLIRSIQKREKT